MAITDKLEGEGFIKVESILSMQTMEPLVQIEWAGRKAQFGLNEAREHAQAILESAEAAESDAFVFQWLTRDIIGTSDDEHANFKAVIEEFRAFREARIRREKR